MGLMIKETGFDSWKEQEIFFSSKASKPTLSSTHSFIQKGIFFAGV
jgi:hypothetical protein